MNPVRRWRPYIRGFSLVLGWLATAAAAQSGGYFRQIDDLPLMQGLSEVAGAGLAFDKPEGRIVEAYAEGAVSVSAVEAFYAKSLPETWLDQIAADNGAHDMAARKRVARIRPHPRAGEASYSYIY